jgi:hypothetical protein
MVPSTASVFAPMSNSSSSRRLQGWRRGDSRQSRVAQRQGRSEGDPSRRSPPPLPAEILPCVIRRGKLTPVWSGPLGADRGGLNI